MDSRGKEIGRRLADAEATRCRFNQLKDSNTAIHVSQSVAVGVRFALAHIKCTGRLKVDLLLRLLLAESVQVPSEWEKVIVRQLDC